MNNEKLDAKIAYKKINEFIDKSGKYYKTLFHVHTPESYDYKLFKNMTNFSYEEATDEELFNLCINLNILPTSKSYTNYSKIGVEEGIYNSYKEAFAFLIFVFFLSEKNIDIAIITDHNTLDGYTKVDRAIKNLKEIKGKIKGYYPTIILGIELSCADKNHVIGIIDNLSKKTMKALQEWLDYNLVNKREGTVLTSMKVMEDFSDLNIITYIAHLDNADMIQKNDYLSGAYKKTLFKSRYCDFVGCSSYDKISILDNQLHQYVKNKKIRYLVDNDSHCIEDMDINYMWVKGVKRNINMIKEALDNYDVSISFENNVQSLKRQYIKGIHIKSNNGFLKDKNSKEGFTMKFSPFLNCIIGGRGTGKSTVLKFLEYTLNQKCESLDMLNFICLHEHIWLLYIYNDEEYIIQMLNPSIEQYFTNPSDILTYFDFQHKEHYMYKKSDFNTEKIKNYAYKKNLKIYQVVHKKNDIDLVIVKSKKNILRSFFDTTYSVNQLVKTASGEKINDFIFNVMFNNKTIRSADSIIKIRSLNGLEKLIQDTQQIMRVRYKEVIQIIGEFNTNMKDILKIEYTQDGEVESPNFRSWLNLNENGKSYFELNNKKYNICNDNVIDYFEMLFEKNGIFKFLKKIAVCNFEDASILDFVEKKEYKNIDSNIHDITELNEKEFLTLLYARILNNFNVRSITDYLKKYIMDTEEFNIKFNVNSKTGINGVNFKDIKILSLGQKVVAMLDFILGYSEYSNDFRPLIIDQPEDNLDNQYIYSNLVKQLRETKEKRQIILATHNATIVTNSMSDLVCVMNSNGQNGWIETYGYPGIKNIKKEIVNCLEGGVDSFKHKQEVYKEILK